MPKSTIDMLRFGTLGYVFAILGVIVGFIAITKIFLLIKPKKYKKMDNIIMDNYVTPHEEKPTPDIFADLPSENIIIDDHVDTDLNESENNNFDDEIFHQTDENARNDPITFTEFSSCILEENKSDYVSKKRKTEDDSYSILKKRLKNKSKWKVRKNQFLPYFIFEIT